MEQHLLAGRALVPQIVRHRALGEQGADFRSDDVCQPAHARGIARVWGGGKQAHTASGLGNPGMTISGDCGAAAAAGIVAISGWKKAPSIV
jgi:hypothetical protein